MEYISVILAVISAFISGFCFAVLIFKRNMPPKVGNLLIARDQDGVYPLLELQEQLGELTNYKHVALVVKTIVTRN